MCIHAQNILFYSYTVDNVTFTMFIIVMVVYIFGIYVGSYHDDYEILYHDKNYTYHGITIYHDNHGITSGYIATLY